MVVVISTVLDYNVGIMSYKDPEKKKAYYAEYTKRPERIKYIEEYRKRNREKFREANRRWRAKPGNKEKNAAYTRQWRLDNPEKNLQQRRRAIAKRPEYVKRLKRDVVQHYGGRCNHCGIDDIDVLSIDHVNNNGEIDNMGTYRRRGLPIYQRIRRLNYPDDYQVLCFNCNWKKHLGSIRK